MQLEVMFKGGRVRYFHGTHVVKTSESVTLYNAEGESDCVTITRRNTFYIKETNSGTG